MGDLSQQERDRAALEQELLRQRVAQDEKFHAAEFVKFKKASTDAKEVQKFHEAQLVRQRIIQFVYKYTTVTICPCSAGFILVFWPY